MESILSLFSESRAEILSFVKSFSKSLGILYCASWHSIISHLVLFLTVFKIILNKNLSIRNAIVIPNFPQLYSKTLNFGRVRILTGFQNLRRRPFYYGYIAYNLLFPTLALKLFQWIFV